MLRLVLGADPAGPELVVLAAAGQTVRLVVAGAAEGGLGNPGFAVEPARATPGVILHNSQCGRGRSARDTAAFRNPPTSWLAVRPRCRSASGLGTAPNPPSGLIARAMKQDDQCGTDRKVYEAGNIMHKMIAKDQGTTFGRLFSLVSRL